MLGKTTLITILTEVNAIAARLSPTTIIKFLTNSLNSPDDFATLELQAKLAADADLYRSALYFSILQPEMKNRILKVINADAKTLNLQAIETENPDFLAYALASIIPQTSIKELNVSQLHFSLCGLQVIASLAVEKLKLKNIGTSVAASKLNVEIIKIIANNPHLKAIDLSGNHLHENAVAELVKSRTLLRVNVSFNPIQFSGIALFRQMNLTSLNVRNTVTHYDEQQASQAIQGLSQNAYLQSLNLAGLGLQDQDVVSLANLKELVLLDIHSNRLTEISQCLAMQNLQYLNVYHNFIAHNQLQSVRAQGVYVDEENLPSPMRHKNVKISLNLFKPFGLTSARSAPLSSPSQTLQP